MIKKSFLAPLGVFLVFAIVFTAFTPSFASSKETEIQNSLKETDRNSYYTSLASRLKASFPKVLIQDELGEKKTIAYPPEYGGAYIDKSNTLHIVLTKNADMTTKQDYLEIMDNDKDIIFDSGDFALSHLRELQRTLTVVMQEFSIEFIGLNQTANKLDIGLFDSAKENEITELLENKFNDFDARCLAFKDPVGIKPSAADTTSNALAGSDTSSIPLDWATLGFNAYRHATGKAGVVTAGHYAPDDVTISNALGTTIGNSTISQYYGPIDAAFIPFPAGITYSYRLSGWSSPDDCITHYYPNDNISEGEVVDKIGRVTGITTGTILFESISFIAADGTAFWDQVMVSNNQFGGDSGGPVFHTEVQAGTDFHVLIGIATFMNQNHNGYASTVENIMTTFGITPYYGEG